MAEKLPEIVRTAEKDACRSYCYKTCAGIKTRIAKLWPRIRYPVSTKNEKSEPVRKRFYVTELTIL